jgi:molecular chaperone DnaK
VVAIRRGSTDGKIKIPIVEGDRIEAADLNLRIGEFTVDLVDINRDVPLGSEIEIKLEIDSSRLLKGSIYIPLLDREFPLKIDLVRRQPNVDEMRQEFEANKQKLQNAQADTAQMNDAKARQILAELGDENTVASIETLLKSGIDEQAARTFENQLLHFKKAIRQLEAQGQVPRLIADANNEIQWAQEAVEANGSPEERRQFEELKRDVENAINGDMSTLEKRTTKLFQLRIRILIRTPEYWVGFKEYLAERRDAMTDQAQAQLWFNHADKAINGNDLDALKSACTQLRSLLPVMDEFRGYGGTTLKIPNRG